MPPFKEGRDQLNPEETHKKARIAAMRIHVEWAIGRIKNYHILARNCLLSMTKDDLGILTKSRNGDRKIIQSIRITGRPPTKRKKWNQLSQLRWKSTTIITIKT